MRNYIGIAMFFIVGSTAAYGYVDPGTGSIAIQLLFAFFASAFFWAGKVMNVIKRLFSRKSS
jgi:CDP-diglyceride synthetase